MGPHVTLAFSQAHFRRARPLPSGTAPIAPPGLEAGFPLHLLTDVLGLMAGGGTHHRGATSPSGQLLGPVLGSLGLEGSAPQESRGNSQVTDLNLRSHLAGPGWGGRPRLAFEEQRAEVSHRGVLCSARGAVLCALRTCWKIAGYLATCRWPARLWQLHKQGKPG